MVFSRNVDNFLGIFGGYWTRFYDDVRGSRISVLGGLQSEFFLGGHEYEFYSYSLIKIMDNIETDQKIIYSDFILMFYEGGMTPMSPSLNLPLDDVGVFFKRNLYSLLKYF